MWCGDFKPMNFEVCVFFFPEYLLDLEIILHNLYLLFQRICDIS